jgi:hypothetical protein
MTTTANSSFRLAKRLAAIVKMTRKVSWRRDLQIMIGVCILRKERLLKSGKKKRRKGNNRQKKGSKLSKRGKEPGTISTTPKIANESVEKTRAPITQTQTQSRSSREQQPRSSP